MFPPVAVVNVVVDVPINVIWPPPPVRVKSVGGVIDVICVDPVTRTICVVGTKVAAAARVETELANTANNPLRVIVPVAPETAEPMFTFVIEPDTPPPPMLIVLVVVFAVGLPNNVAFKVPDGVPPKVNVVSAAPIAMLVGEANNVVNVATGESIFGLFIVVVPAMADPMVTLVVEPDAPPVPMLIALVAPLAVALAKKLAVKAAVGVPPRVNVVNAAPSVIVVGVA